MNPRLLAAMIGGLAVGGLAAAALIANRAGAPGSAVVSGKALIGGAFTLTDHTGRRVSAETYKGKVMAVFFGFTHCPDICPSGLQVLSAALDKLGPKADEVAALFVSLDPERDTPQRLAEYMQSFNPRIVGLTGSAEEVAAAAKAYRVFWRKVADEKSKGDYTIDHTSLFYIMGRDGEYVSHAAHASPVERLAEAIGKAL